MWRLREEASAASVLDFGFHFILNHQPYILDGIPEAVRMGVTSFKMFMTYKKRPHRMVTDEFMAKAMEIIGSLGALCQLHCENGDVLCYLEDRAIAAGHTHPRDFPATCPDWTEEEAINRAILIGGLTRCPRLRGPPQHEAGAGADQAGSGRGPTRLDRDVSSIPPAERRRDGAFRPLRQDRPSPAARATVPIARPSGAGVEEGFIATVASDHSPRVPSAKEPGWKNIFVDTEGKPIPFGATLPGDPCPSHV